MGEQISGNALGLIGTAFLLTPIILLAIILLVKKGLDLLF